MAEFKNVVIKTTFTQRIKFCDAAKILIFISILVNFKLMRRESLEKKTDRGKTNI